jgi:hypothetical protein
METNVPVSEAQAHYEEFKQRILDVPGELEHIHAKLQQISNDGNFVAKWFYFKNNYLIPRYGLPATTFLVNLLDGYDEALALVDEKYVPEVKWFKYINEDVLSRIVNYNRNPHSLLSFFSTNTQGNYVMYFTRVDNESFDIHFTFEDKVTFVENVLEDLVNNFEKSTSNVSKETLERFNKLINRMAECVDNE